MRSPPTRPTRTWPTSPTRPVGSGRSGSSTVSWSKSAATSTRLVGSPMLAAITSGGWRSGPTQTPARSTSWPATATAVLDLPGRVSTACCEGTTTAEAPQRRLRHLAITAGNWFADLDRGQEVGVVARFVGALQLRMPGVYAAWGPFVTMPTASTSLPAATSSGRRWCDLDARSLESGGLILHIETSALPGASIHQAVGPAARTTHP